MVDLGEDGGGDGGGVGGDDGEGALRGAEAVAGHYEGCADGEELGGGGGGGGGSVHFFWKLCSMSERSIVS